MIGKLFYTWFLLLCICTTLQAQTLEQSLLAIPPKDLIQAVKEQGDARRGAIVFHHAVTGCAKCHSVASENDPLRLGPNLALLKGQGNVSDEQILKSILQPSESIRKGYESVTVLQIDGTVLTGLKLSQDKKELRIRDTTGMEVLIPSAEIEEVVLNKLSIMPAGVINTVASRQQFLDLAKYVFAIRDEGPDLARELQPPKSLIAFELPEYESQVDHKGLIENLDDEAFKRGEAIYERLCINCHGNLGRPGSLPTALRFAEGKFRNGNDAFAMYRTLTHGFGLMMPQTWMVPKQKYDVIHYVRETYLKPHNPSQYQPVEESYLASLPEGNTFGPEPTEFAPWRDMNYGPWMHNTIEVSQDGSNIAYKGLAVRLDSGPGGVSQGNQWLLFDHDTMRVAAGWQYAEGSNRFIDWQGIHFDGRHQAHPHLVGEVIFSNPNGPGWANPETGTFEDDLRVVGRDGKRYGPLPKSWARYKSMQRSGESISVSYSVGEMGVTENFSIQPTTGRQNLFLRILKLQPTEKPQRLLIDSDEKKQKRIEIVSDEVVHWKEAEYASHEESSTPEWIGNFDGKSWLETTETDQLDMSTRDFTITARIKTGHDGVIFAQTIPGPKWVPNASVLFLRGGRLCYDIGWVGVVRSNQKVSDQQWHDIAMSWNHKSSKVTLYVDGKSTGQGNLKPMQRLEHTVARIGYGAPNFPNPSSFQGSIRKLCFFQRELTPEELAKNSDSIQKPFARWFAGTGSTGPSLDRMEYANHSQEGLDLVAGMVGQTTGCHFETEENRLCLSIPASDKSRTITVWIGPAPEESDQEVTAVLKQWQNSIHRHIHEPNILKDLNDFRPLWPEKLTTTVEKGTTDENGFAIDILTPPDPNPWLARLRFSGLDFFPDGDRMAVCTWDGDVFLVSGLTQLDRKQASTLTWKRIASGLFQPLGLKIVKEEIYLTCRDQLVVLRDLNGDGETDRYDCFNNDHQVTEHFHEFAMGLQRDDQGNFYYAKSARHAKTALVPHHGTLLRVSPDGSNTEILATGFRAANGVCLNPDGSFVVTDQEGHWNPKNRINWVVPGEFYGNMYGYHNVTDESDDAMQPPLCWITNAFDRSPSELLWTESDQWGNLNGTLMNLSYGYGKVFTVPHQKLSESGHVQGGMCPLPLPQFPTGTMRGRFHPIDKQLYICGLFAWGSSQQAKEGGLYRIRYTGNGATMPTAIHASSNQLQVTFSDPLEPQAARELNRYRYQAWSLKRTKNYGSKHYDEYVLEIESAQLSDDGHVLILTIPGLKPTWCYELKCNLITNTGRSVERIIHGTIHNLP